MSEFKLGDRVRIKDRCGWPSPPGFRLAGKVGVVMKWSEWEDIFEPFSNYIYIMVNKTEGGDEKKC